MDEQHDLFGGDCPESIPIQTDNGSEGLARVNSAAVVGVNAYTVEVEICAVPGQEDKFSSTVVGLPDAAVKESTERVFSALNNSSLETPWNCRWLINLAPADIRKEGPSFDLPIAVGTLAALGQMPGVRLEEWLLIGELALSGKVRRVKGILPIALHAREQGIRRLIVPSENAEEAAVVDGVEVYPADNLAQVVAFLRGERAIPALCVGLEDLFDQEENIRFDFAEVKGQEGARRAIEVAVAGGHNILMIGSPGCGKSMIAKRIPGILPRMSLDEALETTKIHSISGTLPPHQAIIGQRLFRNPHHTVSDAGLLGGGTHPMPGEVSLAHNGVLFLDELPEFARNVLEVMRQPLEDGQVTISRATASVTFPCRFMLVAAMNPCPCGYRGDPKRECRCTYPQVQRYMNKISGPLLDRIDIHIEVPSVGFDDLTTLERGESSAEIRSRVERARGIQQERFREVPGVHCNAEMGTKELNRYCVLTNDALNLLRVAMEDLNLSARAYDRILKVARTLADLDDRDNIEVHHLAEAINYRSLDRQKWL